MVRPFTESGQLRTFDESVDPYELKWHWDEEDRFVTPVHETNWQIQFDDKLPENLIQDVGFFISAGVWHRLHKGTGSLTLNVLKCPTKV